MVTIIIPAYNEEKTIGSVIRRVRESLLVTEIIVVDDQSADGTISEAYKEGARIITSPSKGKGSSMREGMMLASNDILVFLDADIPNYATGIVELLTEPILTGKADFVKSYFDRQAGRVTELLVRPMLENLFPHLVSYKQPLSGMIAGRKQFFEMVEFENDYGVDIGLLIDMHHMQARIHEVCIGTIENDMQPLQTLGRMAKQVAGAIFRRVERTGGPQGQDEVAGTMMHNQIEHQLRKLPAAPHKVIVFDMDNTLLRGSFIHTLAEKFEFKKELKDIVAEGHHPLVRTKKIARLLRGRTFGELIHTAELIPLINDAAHVVQELKSRGYVCGIISDSYQCITNHVKNLTGMDFALGNVLEFHKSVATGEVKIPSGFIDDTHSICGHDHCKSNMLMKMMHKLGIQGGNSVAVGDGENDMCMIQRAGTGVAFNATYSLLPGVSDYVFRTGSLMPVLDVAN